MVKSSDQAWNYRFESPWAQWHRCARIKAACGARNIELDVWHTHALEALLVSVSGSTSPFTRPILAAISRRHDARLHGWYKQSIA